MFAPSPSGSARRRARRLSHPLNGPFSTELGQRLALTSVLAGLAFGCAWLLGRDTPRPLLGVFTLASWVLAVIVHVSARAVTGTKQVVLLGHAYELGLVALITLSERWSDGREVLAYQGGASWVPLVLVVFAFIVPASMVRTAMVAGVGASLGPLVALASVSTSLSGSAFAAPLDWLRQFLPAFLAAGFAAALSRLRSQTRPLETADRLAGSYVLGASLGKGGMGEVFSASHAVLGRPAAVKIVDPDHVSERLGEDPQTVFRRFEREARATAKLTSPHVVTLFDFGTTDNGTFYYVMEKLNGLDLETMVARHGPLVPERVVHLLIEAADALQEAHALGLIHRDVKPANLFACRVGTRVDFVKVLDFGLVVSAVGSETRLTMDGLTSGTPAYMAPEMARSQAVDARTDIYGLGCLAYWLLTGRLVFESSSPLEILRQHVMTAPTPPSARAPAPLPPELDDAVLACLEKAPDRRPSSATEFADRLRAVPVERPWDQRRTQAWWSEFLARS